MTSVQKIHLSNFRNFQSLDLEFSSGISLILGHNGVGKTNLLEAISQLTPGRGIRSSTAHEMCKKDEIGWDIDAHLQTKVSIANIHVAYDRNIKKKNLEFNGTKITQGELANFASAIWLTPQMDGLFNGTPSDRRRFLDRLTLANVPNHAEIVGKYEKTQRERIEVLVNNFSDNTWLDVLEREMAKLSIIITQNRQNTIESLNEHVQSIDSGFPKIYVELESKLLKHLDGDNAESSIIGVLKSFRVQDRDSAKTTFGPNRTDFLGYYMPDRIPAVYCSTGQQKSLLISILMAHQISLVKRDILSPILLLDEVFVHLDDNKRASLAEFLIHNKSQCFITSTELQLEKLLKYPKIVSF